MDNTESTLKRLKLICLNYIDKEWTDLLSTLPEIEFINHVDFMSDEIVMRITQKVYGHQLEQIECKYPRNWKESVKERFAPEWFKRHYPVKYTITTLTAKELYPMLSLPDKDPILHLERLDRG